MKKKLLFAAAFVTVSATAAESADSVSNWTRFGNASLQFTQGYVSKNWYKGGESNMALIATGEYNANWKKNRWAWDNKVEAKLGYVTTRSDEFHNYMTNQDLLKLTSKLGYQATKHWYYTAQVIGQTQFCPGYKTNTEGEFSKFFSPAYLTLSLGMDYKYEKEDYLKFSAFISPASYNLKYVNDPLRNFDAAGDPRSGKIDGTQFGLPAGEFNTYGLGASANCNLYWKLCKYVTWTSNATWFSPLYGVKKNNTGGFTEIMWENTFDMPLNKYFSTKLYTCLRFDDSVGSANKGEGWGYFQFSELLSFGLSYAF